MHLNCVLLVNATRKVAQPRFVKVEVWNNGSDACIDLKVKKKGWKYSWNDQIEIAKEKAGMMSGISNDLDKFWIRSKSLGEVLEKRGAQDSVETLFLTVSV